MPVKCKTSTGWVEVGGPKDECYQKSETYSKTEFDTLLADKANTTDVYTKTESDAKFQLLSNKTTSISSSSTDTQYPSAKATYSLANTKLNLSGGTMTGAINMGSNVITLGGYNLYGSGTDLYWGSNKIMYQGVADVAWTTLVNSSAVPYGTIHYAIKNNIIFIEGSGMSTSSVSTSTMILNYYPLLAAYRPTIEVKGQGWGGYGTTTPSMVWVATNGYIYAHSTFGGISDYQGRFAISYPIF